MGAGRKSKYETHVKPYLDLVKSMRIDGAREEDIMKRLDIGHSAFNEYKNKYPELKEALKHSKETLVAKLEQTLFQKALDGNTTALIFSLKNLAPSKWADKVDVSGNVEIKEFSNMLSRFVDKI